MSDSQGPSFSWHKLVQEILATLKSLIKMLARLVYYLIDQLTRILLPLFRRIDRVLPHRNKQNKDQDSPFKHQVQEKVNSQLQPGLTPLKSFWQKLSLPLQWGVALGVLGLVFFLASPSYQGTASDNLLGLKAQSSQLTGQDHYQADNWEIDQDDVSVYHGPEEKEPADQALTTKDQDHASAILDEKVAQYESKRARYPRRATKIKRSGEEKATDSKLAQESIEPDSSNAGSEYPSQSPKTEESQVQAGGSYQVQAGDSLYRIAQDHGMTVDELMDLNGMTRPALMPGQRIKVK
ncbi:MULTISPECIES: LysM peptidoglycan-binding domain-containing protein [Aerococcus]|uniref:LysM peptidoglycan-binding domain-containing protein n=1 Tax=Aerococcus TaxID=1375 RepID=UPI001CD26CB2|nr:MULTISPECIES: LysM peptidoglycan-binding domain-containing protein [Aerococcus]MDK6689232.1 LysM peptidoglycan-binding domain-containing protein [Aerococcus urinae]MDK8133684.1 LysM peptidoglycan-binding domain-containing protein [Aerococcus urinae]MDK8485140.1 LysM peptidoglycan-binding domain-containing protein [Aerococcus urinae]MDL5179090.1 LysM peptidoglycan-binding domain-containing protein [Aerococcus tenax]MDL5207989.1 LysM peptidoglycan-binding domain-containing protein [Aerococcus